MMISEYRLPITQECVNFSFKTLAFSFENYMLDVSGHVIAMCGDTRESSATSEAPEVVNKTLAFSFKNCRLDEDGTSCGQRSRRRHRHRHRGDARVLSATSEAPEEDALLMD